MALFPFGHAPAGLTILCCLTAPACFALPVEVRQCLLEELAKAADTATVGEIRAQCRDASRPPAADTLVGDTAPETASGTSGPLETRITMERTARANPYVLTPHRPNYILPVTYNSSTNADPFPAREGRLEDLELKFQLSFKFPLTRPLLNDRATLFFAYTNLSFWQAYNSDFSAPFRETNHEPEFFLTYLSDNSLFGIRHRLTTLGISHESNGRGGTLSRSWNRIYADFVFSAGNFAFSVKPWYRIPEDDKSDPLDPTGDDNPDIDDYMGYGEFRAAYKWRRHTFSLMLRNNLREADNRGAVQLGWSFPLTDNIDGYAQYFNGYGESLIDYNDHTNRVGLGVSLTDWL